MLKQTDFPHAIPVFIMLVASVFAIALFSLPWVNSGFFRTHDLSLPDLVVSDVSWTTMPDGNIRVTATIRNIGIAHASGFNILFWDVTEGKSAGITTLSSLAPGESATTSIIHPENRMNCTMRVTANWGQMIRESDLTNNDAQTTIQL